MRPPPLQGAGLCAKNECGESSESSKYGLVRVSNFNQQLVLTSRKDHVCLVGLARKLWSPPDRLFANHSQNSRVRISQICHSAPKSRRGLRKFSEEFVSGNDRIFVHAISQDLKNATSTLTRCWTLCEKQMWQI